MTGHGMRELIRGRSNSSLTFYGMLVSRLSTLIALLLLAWQVFASQAAWAQNVFRVRIDTMTVKAGDTATVNVYYSFTSTKPHNLNGFVARFLFDSNLVKITGYITNGTASDGLMTTESHLGLAALGTQEINLSNPVLFKMRVAASRALADTAWVHWDPDWPMFASDAGVDTVIQRDGWFRTAVVAAHTLLHAPQRTVHGTFTGPYADSVKFDLPITISDITSANVTTAALTFAYDRNRLAIESVSSKLATASVTVLPSASGAFDTARIEFQSSSTIAGNDTLVTLHLFALIGPDTVCTALMGVKWTPLNASARLGTTDVDFDSVCPIHLFGLYVPPAAVKESEAEAISLYPNPAKDHVVLAGTGDVSIEVFDALGRLAARCDRAGDMWNIPQALVTGIYRVVLHERNGRQKATTLIIER